MLGDKETREVKSERRSKSILLLGVLLVIVILVIGLWLLR